MAGRVAELVLLTLVLIVMTLSLAFQFENHLLLRDILTVLQTQPRERTTNASETPPLRSSGRWLDSALSSRSSSSREKSRSSHSRGHDRPMMGYQTPGTSGPGAAHGEDGRNAHPSGNASSAASAEPAQKPDSRRQSEQAGGSPSEQQKGMADTNAPSGAASAPSDSDGDASVRLPGSTGTEGSTVNSQPRDNSATSESSVEAEASSMSAGPAPSNDQDREASGSTSATDGSDQETTSDSTPEMADGDPAQTSEVPQEKQASSQTGSDQADNGDKKAESTANSEPDQSAENPDTADGGEAKTDGNSAAWEDYGPTVIRIIEALLNGEYQAVVDRFDPNGDMAARLSADDLASMMDPIREQHGGFDRVLSRKPVSKGLPPRLHAFRVKTALEDGHELTFTITLDEQQRIAGMLMK